MLVSRTQSAHLRKVLTLECSWLDSQVILPEASALFKLQSSNLDYLSILFSDSRYQEQAKDRARVNIRPTQAQVQVAPDQHARVKARERNERKEGRKEGEVSIQMKRLDRS